jgi:hypothetical protein
MSAISKDSLESTKEDIKLEPPWKFSEKDLRRQEETLKEFKESFASNTRIMDNSFLLLINNFVSNLLTGNYNKSEVIKVIKYLELVLDSVIIWILGLHLNSFTDNIVSKDTLSCAYEIISKILGLNPKYPFHTVHNKVITYRYKPWEGSEPKNSVSKLSYYFINLFGSLGGYNLITKLLDLR